MSIRKVSDLPELEPYKNMGVLDDSYMEISMLSSILDGSGITYASRKVSFGELKKIIVEAVHETISSEYQLYPATNSRLGGVKVNLPNNLDNNTYGVSSDENNRLFIRIPDSDKVESVDGIRTDDSGNITLNSISNIVTCGNYLSSERSFLNRNLSIGIDMHLYPDFKNRESVDSTSDFANGISAINNDMFVYAYVDPSGYNCNISCQMSFFDEGKVQWCQVMTFPLTYEQKIGLPFNIQNGNALRIVSDKDQYVKISGYKCPR